MKKLIIILCFLMALIDSFSQREKESSMRELIKLFCVKNADVEKSETRNELVFEILSSDNVSCLLTLMNSDSVFCQKVLKECKNPVNDIINLDKCIETVRKCVNDSVIKQKVIDSLQEAKNK